LAKRVHKKTEIYVAKAQAAWQYTVTCMYARALQHMLQKDYMEHVEKVTYIGVLMGINSGNHENIPVLKVSG
jgi:hypothetical protein